MKETTGEKDELENHYSHVGEEGVAEGHHGIELGRCQYVVWPLDV